MSNENIPIGWLQDPDTEEKYYPHTHYDAVDGVPEYTTSEGTGVAGVVPAASSAEVTANKFLRADGKWALPSAGASSVKVDGVNGLNINNVNTVYRVFNCSSASSDMIKTITPYTTGIYDSSDVQNGDHIRVDFSNPNTYPSPVLKFNDDATTYPIYIEDVPMALYQDYRLSGIVDFVFIWTSNGFVAKVIGKQKNFTGATAQANGIAGIVPQPLTVNKDSFLCGDGTWKSVNTLISEITTVLENDQTLAAAFAVAIKAYIV